jgi:hypothetical protein
MLALSAVMGWVVSKRSSVLTLPDSLHRTFPAKLNPERRPTAARPSYKLSVDILVIQSALMWLEQ